MLINNKRVFILLLLIQLSINSFATHIVGGVMTYRHIGGDNYELTLKVYRDCNPGNLVYDQPADIEIYNATTHAFIQTINMSHAPEVNIDPNLSDSCLIIPPGICVEEAIYTTNINLPPIPGGYRIYYKKCCRNFTILNIINPGNAGAVYETIIPDTSITFPNSSPYYNFFPPIAICINKPINFDHSATDSDGDSLVYELCRPYSCVTASGGGYIWCDDAFGPPFPYVTWRFLAPGPYSTTYPLNSSPAIAIDTFTGFLTGVPNRLGQFVVGICVKEYKNGVLIGVTKRDFQFNIVDCQVIAFDPPPDDSLCSGDTIVIGPLNPDLSYSYLWNPFTGLNNFFIPNPLFTALNLSDTSVVIDYVLSVIAVPGCDSTDTITITVFPIVPLADSSGTVVIHKGESVMISASGGVNYTWSPDSSIIGASNIPNPIVSPDKTTTYKVIIEDINGCKKTVSVKVVVVSLDFSNAFTPNGDGANDIFYAMGDGWEELEFKIFNRWGELVFETKDITQGWNGKYKGIKQPAGTYVYYVKATDFLGSPEIKRGNITLIR